MQQNTIVLSYDCPDGIYLKVTLFRSVGMRLDKHLLTLWFNVISLNIWGAYLEFVWSIQNSNFCNFAFEEDGYTILKLKQDSNELRPRPLANAPNSKIF